MIRLRQNVGMLPGGILFQDPRVPEKKWLDASTFMDARVSEVVAWRQQNPEIYDPVKDAQHLSPAFVREQVTMYNYHRLGGNAAWFINTETKPAPTPSTGKFCACGSELAASICVPCGGKITGYTCPKCGNKYTMLASGLYLLGQH